MYLSVGLVIVAIVVGMIIVGRGGLGGENSGGGFGEDDEDMGF